MTTRTARSLPAASTEHGTPTLNSSFSRTYLTKNNYSGPRLLKAIRAPHDSHSPHRAGMSPSSTMRNRTEEDVMRPPESSEDDTEHSRAQKEEKRPDRPTSSPSKRKRQSTKPTRVSKRKRLEDKPDLPPSTTLPDPSRSFQQTDFDVFSQSQKKRPGYGNRNKLPMEPDVFLRRNSPRILAAALDTTDIGDQQRSPPKRTLRLDTEEDFEMGQKLHESKLPSLATLIEDQEPELTSSASTTGTLNTLLMRTPEPEGPDDIEHPSLSSPPTSPETGQEQEKKSMVVICPVCRKEVDRAQCGGTSQKPRLLPPKKQWDFCRQHRTNDARVLWEQKGYPSIDWQALEFVRVPKYILHLKKLLQRETSSHYLDVVELNINKAKGNRRKIKEYLADEVLELVKAGYYGPRGSTIIMQVINKELSKELTNMNKDKLVRAVGMGNFALAVLVPEVTVRLVMEDCGFKNEAEARKKIDESTEAGLLLNPDEDHVEESFESL